MPVFPSRFRAFLGSRSRGLHGVEHAAGATVAALILLNVAGVISRGKPAAEPVAGQAGAVASSPARERVAVKKRAATTRAPVSAQLFQPQRVILDATGVPALDPHRAAPLPLKLDIVAHVGAAVATVELEQVAPGITASGSKSTEPKEDVARPAKKRTHAEKSRSIAAVAKARSERRVIAADDDQRESMRSNAAAKVAKPGKLAEKVEKAAAEKAAKEAKSTKVKLASRAVHGEDPTPGELVLRTLRGPA